MGQGKHRKYLRKVTKEQIGYNDFLNGNYTKTNEYYRENIKSTWHSKDVVSMIKNNTEGIDNWKSAKYGNNAESMASEVKRLIRGRILSEQALINLLKSQGYYQLP